MEPVRQLVRQSRPSHDSTLSGSNGLSISPSSNLSSDPASRRQSSSSTGAHSTTNGAYKGNLREAGQTASRDSPLPENQRHIIHLSSIEHCMPRAYIRVCLAYQVPDHVDLDELVDKLNRFARKLVDSKPYLAGHVVPAPVSKSQPGLAEIHFTDEEFLNFPKVELQYVAKTDIPLTYAELDDQGLPPSRIRPDLVSALPEGTNDDFAPVFRLQANVVEGGLIVSAYLHHCISDGTGLGLILTGSVLKDDFAFDRHLESKGYATSGLNRRLEEFANQQSIVRQQLSWSFPNQIRDRHIQSVRPSPSNGHHLQPKPRGRGCIFAFSRDQLRHLKAQLGDEADGHFMTPNDVLQAFLWHHMTAARAPCLHNTEVITSKLFTPVNIRSKIEPPLSDSYFGAAVDFATTEKPIADLSNPCPSASILAETALAIRRSINGVDEPYIRQAIALARDPDPEIDVRDLMGKNMDRTHGADMYITSWQKLDLYEADMELELGRPDWVRKPWSKDPGSCIILPNDDRKPFTEVLVQMAEDDMGRLHNNEQFMSYVLSWVE